MVANYDGPLNQECPENRGKDTNGAPLPSAAQVREEAILNRRVWEEKARYERGFPCAGHDWDRELTRER